MTDLRHPGELLIPTVAYGDAAGLPFETKTAAQITKRYGRVRRLMPTLDNIFFKGEYEPGVYSDDTQLSIAVADGIMTADGFDLQAQAETHIAAYNDSVKVEHKGKTSPRGWGGSTSISIEQIMNGTSPLESGSIEGSGNGVIMKLSPLAYYQVAAGLDSTECHEQYDQLTAMTHNNAVSKVGTRVHGDILRGLLESNQAPDIIAPFAEHAAILAHYHEWQLGEPSRVLSKALKFLRQPQPMTQGYILESTDGKGFYVPQTLAMAYGSFIAGHQNYEDTVYTAVNLGGDTDSIASIAGAMVNFANKGQILFPADFEKVQDLSQLRKISKAFTDFALKGTM